MPKFAFTGRQASGKFPGVASRVWVVGRQFRYFWVCWLFAGWLGAQGISEVSKALIFEALGFCPALFKFRFVAAFGVSGGALVILLGTQCHKLFLGFC